MGGGQPSFQPFCSVKDAFIVHLLSTYSVFSGYSVNAVTGYSHHHHEFHFPYYVPGTLPSPLHTLFHLLLMTTGKVSAADGSHFIDDGSTSCPNSFP